MPPWTTMRCHMLVHALSHIRPPKVSRTAASYYSPPLKTTKNIENVSDSKFRTNLLRNYQKHARKLFRAKLNIAASFSSMRFRLFSSLALLVSSTDEVGRCISAFSFFSLALFLSKLGQSQLIFKKLRHWSTRRIQKVVPPINTQGCSPHEFVQTSQSYVLPCRPVNICAWIRHPPPLPLFLQVVVEDVLQVWLWPFSFFCFLLSLANLISLSLSKLTQTWGLISLVGQN